jgi:hypothetical protein
VARCTSIASKSRTLLGPRHRSTATRGTRRLSPSLVAIQISMSRISCNKQERYSFHELRRAAVVLPRVPRICATPAPLHRIDARVVSHQRPSFPSPQRWQRCSLSCQCWIRVWFLRKHPAQHAQRDLKGCFGTFHERHVADSSNVHCTPMILFCARGCGSSVPAWKIVHQVFLIGDNTFSEHSLSIAPCPSKHTLVVWC